MKIDDFSDWLEELGGKNPVPGGGAVAAVSAAIAASTLKMAAEYTTGPKFAEHEEQMRQFSDELKDLAAQALQEAEADSEAFRSVREAYKKENTEDIENALTAAAKPPAEVISICDRLIDIAIQMKDKTNPNLISDVAVAISTANGAIESAILNIEINAAAIKNSEQKARMRQIVKRSDQLIDQGRQIVDQIRNRIKEKGQQ